MKTPVSSKYGSCTARTSRHGTQTFYFQLGTGTKDRVETDRRWYIAEHPRRRAVPFSGTSRPTSAVSSIPLPGVTSPNHLFKTRPVEGRVEERFQVFVVGSGGGSQGEGSRGGREEHARHPVWRRPYKNVSSVRFRFTFRAELPGSRRQHAPPRTSRRRRGTYM